MKFLAVFVVVLAMSSAAPRFPTWDVNELSAAISNPSTDPALVPYLIDALNNLMETMWSGSPITAIPVVTPVGVVPSPSEAVIVPGVAAEVAPAAPASVSEVSSGSPLVQIIVNINSGSKPVADATPVAPVAVGESVLPTPEAVLPTPVSVVEQPAAVSPVVVVDQPAVSPIVVVDQPAVSPIVVVDQPAVSPIVVVDQPAVSPVVVVDQPAVSPVVVVDTPAVVEPVIVVEPEVQPIAVGEPVLPEIAAPINPIDVIAVAAPDVNPIDIIAPVPAVAETDNGIIV